MTRLPTGTVTFLFTDIEGSTKLLRDLGDHYAKVLADHRSALRAAFAQHGGVEVDTQGDAFFVAFARPSDAVAAAASAQRSLEASPVRVRMGIHTGQPTCTDEGYVGIDVHRAARICAAGHGGQVLVSRATRVLLEPANELRDLGEHRLKDLAEPEWLFQLILADRTEQFPPLRSLSNTNLPAEASSLIGRQRELLELRALLRREDVRLVTLTGVGGTGKTRLALRVAASLVEDFRNGVFLVALASLSDPDLVLGTVAQTLGVKESAGETLAQRLRRWLEGKSVLLVFDNFEHLIVAGPDVGHLLGFAPQLKVLVTSRERLRLVGEHEYPIAPLPEDDAVALFDERARAVEPGFLLSAQRGSVERICRGLDGLPLAVELAAVRVKALSTDELLSRLERRLPLLVGGSRDLPERQQTLQATIDWSFELLDERERRVFVRLGVFAGGCTFEAATAICEAELDQITSLLDKSLLRREGDRYLMLETIREYALQRLNESEDRADILRRYERWYIEFAERSDSKLRGPQGSSTSRRLRLEHDNFRTVLRRALDRADAETMLRLATALWSFWLHHGHLREGLAWLNQALSLSDNQPEKIRAQAHLGASSIAMTQGELSQGYAHADASLRLSRELGDDRLIAIARINLGNIAGTRGDFADAAMHYAEARLFFANLADETRSAQVLRNWGHIELARGNPDRALDLLTESLVLSRKIGNDRQLAFTLSSIAMTRLSQGDPEAARVQIEEALERAVLAEDDGLTLDCIETSASVLALRKQWEPAARLFGFAEAYRVATGLSPINTLRILAQHVATVRAAMHAETVARSWASGRALTLADAVAEARSLLPASSALLT